MRCPSAVPQKELHAIAEFLWSRETMWFELTLVRGIWKKYKRLRNWNCSCWSTYYNIGTPLPINHPLTLHFQSTSTPLPPHFTSTLLSLSLHFHSTSNLLSLYFHTNSTPLPLYFHTNSTLLTLHFHSHSNSTPLSLSLYFHSNSTPTPLSTTLKLQQRRANPGNRGKHSEEGLRGGSTLWHHRYHY